MGQLTERTALATGASRGIGALVAHALAPVLFPDGGPFGLTLRAQERRA